MSFFFQLGMVRISISAPERPSFVCVDCFDSSPVLYCECEEVMQDVFFTRHHSLCDLDLVENKRSGGYEGFTQRSGAV